MYIMLCSIISVRQQPNVALYVIRANKDILYCIVLITLETKTPITPVKEQLYFDDPSSMTNCI